MWLVLFVKLVHCDRYDLLFENSERQTSNAQRSTSNSEYRPWWFLFYLALAGGFLAKGPIAWTPLLTLAAMKLFVGDVEPAKRFKFARGILLMLTIVALWGVPALIQTHGEFFRIGIGRHVVGRSFGAMEGQGSNSLGIYLLLLPFYFVTIFASFFPWSIKLPALANKLWRSRDKTCPEHGRRIDIYLVCGIAVSFIIFTLIETN